MSNKLRLKIGDFELEVEGDSELIEKERKEFFTLFPVEEIISNLKKTGIQKSSELKNISNNTDEKEYNTNYESIHQFYRAKGFISNTDIVMGVAYYIYKIKQNELTRASIKEGIVELNLSKELNISQYLTENKKKGFLEKEKNSKKYRLLKLGIEWVEKYGTLSNQ